MKFTKWRGGENVLSIARRMPAAIANKAIEEALEYSRFRSKLPV